MDWLSLLYLIPLLPLLGAAASGAAGPRAPRPVTNAIALGSTALSMLLALAAVGSFVARDREPVEQVLYLWSAGELQIEMGFLLDPLSSVMLVVVTVVGFLIHVYSVGYMGHEGGYQRYFAYLN
ncbi:MAG: NADH-quinone oxidoreductase subunit L, partial [Thermoanaerobaculia bacterium]|nr:NADH-quinone oxidoreductase subunit L [Thermoanaerobaculia bacterium]